METSGSKELACLHTNLLQSQNYDEKMLVKSDNLHDSLQMKNLNKIRKKLRYRRPFLSRFSFRISTIKYTTHRLHTYIISSASYPGLCVQILQCPFILLSAGLWYMRQYNCQYILLFSAKMFQCTSVTEIHLQTYRLNTRRSTFV